MRGERRERRENRKEKLKKSRLHERMNALTVWLDRYYIDGIAGLIPGGIGDTITALFALVHIYFSLFRLHSIPLTLAVLNNSLRDLLLGLIPFYVGDIIDFFHQSNTRNMRLINGFINDDQAVIAEVNRKASQSLVACLLLLAGILLVLLLIAWIATKLGTLLFS